MELKVTVVDMSDHEDIEKRRDKAVKLSHAFLRQITEDDDYHALVHPHTLMMMLAHTFTHILMAAPTEENMRLAMVDMIKEINYNDVLMARREHNLGEEDELGHPPSAAVN